MEAETAQNAADGGPAEPRLLRDMHPGEALPPQLLDLGEQGWGGGLAQALRPRAAIGHTGVTFGLITADPFTGSLAADFELGGRRVQSPALEEDAFGQLLSTIGGESGILMNVHSISPG